jgi:hypothetical protein
VQGLLVGAILMAASFQFLALSFDGMAGWQARLPFLADGLSIQLPSSGRTDSGYWVVPDVLEYVTENRRGEVARLGILVNQPQVNSKHFIYLAYSQYPQVHIDELATIGWEVPVYPRLFEEDFVLLIDPPPHYARRPDAEATLERLLTSEDDAFHRAFDLAEVYPQPGDQRLLLYERRFAGGVDEDAAYFEALVADLGEVGAAGEAVLVLPPALIYALGREGDGSLDLYALPAGKKEAGIAGEDLALLDELGAVNSRLWVVVGNGQEADPDGLVARHLAESYYRAGHSWYGPLQVLLYAPPAADPGGSFGAGEMKWEDGISLEGYRFVEEEVPLGQILRLDLRWQAEEAPGERYKTFLHLLDGEGQLVAQRDGEPVDGLRPTTGWQPGEVVEDRQGLWLPDTFSNLGGAALAEGDYRLVLGFYQPETGDRLAACCPAGDGVLLATVRVEGDRARILDADGN